jgi:hypothetical protein
VAVIIFVVVPVVMDNYEYADEEVALRLPAAGDGARDKQTRFPPPLNDTLPLATGEREQDVDATRAGRVTSSPAALRGAGGGGDGRHFQRPELFNGENSEFADFIFHFEQVSQWNRWNEGDMAMQLAMCLRGPAAHVLYELDAEARRDYATLRSFLQRRFEPEERQLSSRCEFRARTKRSGETATQFAAALSHLSRRGWPAHRTQAREAMVLEQFLAGLLDRDLRRHVTFGHPMSLQGAVGLAEEYEAFDSVDARGRRRKPDANSTDACAAVSGGDGPSRRDTEVPKNRNTLPQQVAGLVDEIAEIKKMLLSSKQGSGRRNRGPFTGICYFCDCPGHMARDCPKRQASESSGKE